MKTIKLLLLLLIFGSCEKSNFEIPKHEPVTITPNNSHRHNQDCFTIWGKWELIGSSMYLTNLETNEEWVESQFGNGGGLGSLRYYEPLYDFEVLEKNKTTWFFSPPNNIPGIGRFVLNQDSLNVYGLNVTSSNYTIIENFNSLSVEDLLLGGSSRNISPFFSGDCRRMEVMTQEVYENIDGYNHHYYSILQFLKKKS
tara:strand:+ start:1082 stop:1675 length:594 start_codon:yes stop_codon:yes gene_type:complete